MSLMFMLLIGLLMPAVIVLTDLDHTPRTEKYLVVIIAIYLVVSILVTCTDIIVFYVFYELLVMLVFFAIQLSTNARGCIEAALFFLG